MKVEIKSKKGLRTILSVIVDKKNIQTKMDERLKELQKEVALKGFRPGKVPHRVIKSQFGKSIYGEVVDKILRETTTKAIDEKKLKVAGQPKIDLKQFGEGKDLNYELQIDCLPSFTLKNFDKFKATNFKLKIEDHPKYFQSLINNLSKDQFGYDLFGLKHSTKRSIEDYYNAFKERYYGEYKLMVKNAAGNNSTYSYLQ